MITHTVKTPEQISTYRRTYRYFDAGFIIDPIQEEYTLDGQYKYAIALKTPNGTLVSEPLIIDEDDTTPSVFYDLWCPFDSEIRYERKGKLYLPFNPPDVSRLEIIIFDNIDNIKK